MKNKHYRPNDRPAHPKCKLKSLDTSSKCSCDRLWDYWDGTERGAQALSGRLEMNERAPVDSELVGGEVIIIDPPNDTGGFYKQSELIKTALDNLKK